MDAINSNAYAYLKSLINPQVKIIDAYVRNKWLVAELSSGVKFMVLNNPVLK